MMNLRILIRAGYRGLSWLVLNVIMGILHKREGEGDLTMHRGEGDLKKEEHRDRLESAGLETWRVVATRLEKPGTDPPLGPLTHIHVTSRLHISPKRYKQFTQHSCS